MKKRFISILFLMIGIGGCNSFNTVEQNIRIENKEYVTRSGEIQAIRPQEPLVATPLPVAPTPPKVETRTVTKIQYVDRIPKGYCKVFNLPALPPAPVIPSEEYLKAKEARDEAALDRILRDYIQALSKHSTNMEADIKKAHKEYLDKCESESRQ